MYVPDIIIQLCNIVTLCWRKIICNSGGFTECVSSVMFNKESVESYEKFI